MKHTQIETRPFLTKTIHRNKRTKRLCAPGDEEAEALVVPTKRVRLIGGRLYTVSERTHVVGGRVVELVDGQAVDLVPTPYQPGPDPEPAPLFDTPAQPLPGHIG